MYNSLNRTAELKSLLCLLDTSHPGHFGLETLRTQVGRVLRHFGPGSEVYRDIFDPHYNRNYKQAVMFNSE